MMSNSPADKNIVYCTVKRNYNRNGFKSLHLHKHPKRRQTTHDCSFPLEKRHIYGRFHPYRSLLQKNQLVFLEKKIIIYINLLPTTPDLLLLPNAQMQAHSGGTVKLARAHCDSM